ncbi:MAG TPA: hypothetical protein VJB63_02885 [Patescibacteria group bacterium]|nr:hypothetical protein [Patescibacteria group bacterium]
MPTHQTQLKISLSQRLDELLNYKAMQLGIPKTQLVKFIIIKEIYPDKIGIEKESAPVFTASEAIKKQAQKALKQIDKALIVDSVPDFFAKL